MTANQIVLRVIASLQRHHIPYMLVGSYSSNAFGVAGSTQDVHFVVELGGRSIAPVVNDLAPEIVLDPQMVFESVTMSSRFIARHPGSGFRVELFLLSDDPHDRKRFERRGPQPFLDSVAILPTAEDVVI